jgi:hypothetical protein
MALFGNSSAAATKPRSDGATKGKAAGLNGGGTMALLGNRRGRRVPASGSRMETKRRRIAATGQGTYSPVLTFRLFDFSTFHSVPHLRGDLIRLGRGAESLTLLLGA